MILGPGSDPTEFYIKKNTYLRRGHFTFPFRHFMKWRPPERGGLQGQPGPGFDTLPTRDTRGANQASHGPERALNYTLGSFSPHGAPPLRAMGGGWTACRCPLSS